MPEQVPQNGLIDQTVQGGRLDETVEISCARTPFMKPGEAGMNREPLAGASARHARR